VRQRFAGFQLEPRFARSGRPFDGDIHLPSARGGQIEEGRAKEFVRRGGGGGRFG